MSAHFDSHEDALLTAPPVAMLGAAASIARPPVDLTIYENSDEIEAEWRAFERVADCTVFQAYDWLATWQRHIGGQSGVKPAIVVGRANDGILFMMPLATRPAGFMRELVWLGTELCDYNAPLLAPHFSATVPPRQFAVLWQRILMQLRDRPHLRFDIVRLQKMPAMLGTQSNPMLSLGVTLNPSGAYATELKGNWDTFYAAKRSSATRSRDRSKRRRLAEFGALTFVHAQYENDILVTLDMLAAQKSRAFARMGVSNVFTRPGHLDFYKALFKEPQARSIAHISRLDCGNRTVAVNLGLSFRDTYYHLQASHDDGDLSRFGPGAAHLHDLLRYTIEHGFKVYDFTIGDEPYKRDWCDEVQQLHDHISVASARGVFAFLPLVTLTWLKRLVKQTPALWRAFVRARAFYGSLRQRENKQDTDAAP